ncbi:hypothetical protein [Litoribacillus peritrichatus]|uniref:Uncharacterized protein n=1 Tax=Litoribacillus peritrichatus TaxID=718191 RepID=A0ABP7MIN6_9GAMM
MKLTYILYTNAFSCLCFGSLFSLWPQKSATFLSPETPAHTLVLTFTGIALLLNGIHLMATAMQKTPSRLVVRYFAVGDLAWVIATAIIIYLDQWITSAEGLIASLLVAAAVGVLGSSQWVLSYRHTDPVSDV